MLEEYWIILIVWFVLFAFSLNRNQTELKIVTGITGVFLGLIFCLDANTALQYMGLLVLLLNFYIILTTLFKN